jgi:prepilin-type N-terminal cleavage/methylation domain-containing protein
MKTLKVKSAKAQKGFTLVEMSVVILVAGLMLTAVLQGQSMLETSRAANLLSKVKNVEALLGNFETAKGRLPGDCNSDGLIGFNLNTGAGNTITTGLNYATTVAAQTARSELFSFTGTATTVAGTSTAATSEQHCAAAGSVAAVEANANVWINDLRANNLVGVGTVPRLFAKHIGEDMLFVGQFGDPVTGESYNAMTLANVPAPMAQRLMKSINGNDSLTDTGQLRVIDATGAAYTSNAFAGTTTGSVVNLVYFYRNQPRAGT